MKLVWHAEGLQEVDWIREIFRDVVAEEVFDLSLTCFDDACIHVVSSNVRPLLYYQAYFRECRAKASRLYLLHLSDEWFSGGYGIYRYFDGVFRNFETYLASGPGILTIPEGYSNGTQIGKHFRPADQRKYVWSFAGEIKASRIEMLAALASLGPSFQSNAGSNGKAAALRLPKAEFDAVLDETVFSPCPMGNVILETWRLYESLERGCIPLVETRPTLNYFEDLFGPNPIPSFSTWDGARSYARAIFESKAALLQKQEELRVWWKGHKQQVRGSIGDLLAGASHQAELESYAGLVRNRVPLVHEGLRLVELLRHQSGASLRRRVLNPAGPLQRIWKESVRQGT